jgi:hypothetical protein
MEGHVRRRAILAAALGVLLFSQLQAQTDSSLPRFRQLQIRVEPGSPTLTLPGRWLAAAASLGETAGAMRTGYTELSLRSGVAPLPPDSLSRFGLLRVMGLYRRDELVTATIATLEKLRASLPNDTAVARFDYFFRPNGRWQVDIHDVALARARRPFPTLTWESTKAPLTSAGLMDNEQPGVESIPFGLYRLYVQSHTDSSAFRATLLKLRGQDAPGAAQIAALVNSYEEAAQWFVAATRFLLEQRWVRSGTKRRSPADLVREIWGAPVPIPEIRHRLFGYPEGAVRIGTDSVLVRSLIQPENAAAREWLHRHGTEELVATLHRLALPLNEQIRLKAGNDTYRLSSVRQYAGESFSGFLEPRDLILLDPSYQPVLALGTLIHEWQHILAERARQADRESGAYRLSADQVTLVQLDPFLAEGFAEWMTEVILAGVVEEFPLFAFGESEKRISLAQNDPHQLGYLLVRTLARTLGDVQATRRLMVRSASSPDLVTRDPRVRRAWSGHRGADRTMTRRGEPLLLPMVVFTIEDGTPDLVQSQIIAPYIPRR